MQVKQFCKYNHNTFLVGRLTDRRCRMCVHTRNQKNYYKDIEKSRLLTKTYYRAHINESRSYHLKRNYGLSLDEKINLFKSQKGLCLGCDFKFESVYSAHVDHNHVTKKIRGLLCNTCNRGIGLLKDSPIYLRRLANYLERLQ